MTKEDFENMKKEMIEKINQSQENDNIALMAEDFFSASGNSKDLISLLNLISVKILSEGSGETLYNSLFKLIKIQIEHYLNSTQEDPVLFFKRIMT